MPMGDPLYNIKSCKYISNVGLFLNCDESNIVMYDTDNCDHDYTKLKLKDGIVIAIKIEFVHYFILMILPSITCNFILASFDFDYTVPSDILTEELFNSVINYNKLIRWYSVNSLDYLHEKLSIIPLGVNYHSMSLNTFKTEEYISPLDNENIIISIRNTAKPLIERKGICYSNFHFSLREKFGNPRKDAISKIPKDLIYYEPMHIEQKQTWINQTEYAFVVSPHGNGLDCHRTWEALLLGCIPIVKLSPLDKLYIELPVLVINDWSDITKELLDVTINVFSQQKFDYSRLTVDYWKNLIKSGNPT